MSQTTWCTAADVLSLTGVTVTDPPTQANAIVELHAGRTYNTVDTPLQVGTRDIEWMKRAVAYQAAWMASQPDMYSRMELTGAPTARGSVPLHESALTLAPLARRALKRVSWLKSRSVHVKSPFQDGLGPVSGAVMDYDDLAGW